MMSEIFVAPKHLSVDYSIVSQSPGKMDMARHEQRSYIKIAVLRRRNARECQRELQESFGDNALPNRTLERWVAEFQMRTRSNKRPVTGRMTCRYAVRCVRTVRDPFISSIACPFICIFQNFHPIYNTLHCKTITHTLTLISPYFSTQMQIHILPRKEVCPRGALIENKPC